MNDHADSMQRTMDETNRRRAKQMAYNEEHGITPQAIKKSIDTLIESQASVRGRSYESSENMAVAADPVIEYMSKEQLEKAVKETRRNMEKAAKELDFMQAAQYRDELFALQSKLEGKS